MKTDKDIIKKALSSCIYGLELSIERARQMSTITPQQIHDLIELDKKEIEEYQSVLEKL